MLCEVQGFKDAIKKAASWVQIRPSGVCSKKWLAAIILSITIRVESGACNLLTRSLHITVYRLMAWGKCWIGGMKAKGACCVTTLDLERVRRFVRAQAGRSPLPVLSDWLTAKQSLQLSKGKIQANSIAPTKTRIGPLGPRNLSGLFGCYGEGAFWYFGIKKSLVLYIHERSHFHCVAFSFNRSFDWDCLTEILLIGSVCLSFSCRCWSLSRVW